jgi:hypothetical protein
MRKLITCPETVHLEVIEFEDTELGTVITSCSRLARCGLECTRVCAALIDTHASPDPCAGPWSDDAGIVPLVIVADEFEQPLDACEPGTR